MDIQKMSKEELEAFTGVELIQLAQGIYVTTDGRFTVKHVNHVEVEGVPDPNKQTWFAEEPWAPGKFIDVRKRDFADSLAAKSWLKASYQFYTYIDQYWKRLGKPSRDERISAERLARAKKFSMKK